MQGWRNSLRAHAQNVKFFRVPNSTSPCLLTILALEPIAGLYNRHLNSNREYAYANDLEIKLRVMTVLAKE